MNGIITTVAICILIMAVPADAVTEYYGFSPGLFIPDNNPVGVMDIQDIVGSSIISITDVNVELRINHGFNGKLFVGLFHNDGTITRWATLLDLVGVSHVHPAGYDDQGFDITFDDEGMDDGFGTGIHRYRVVVTGNDLIGLGPGIPLTGSWIPDLDDTYGSLPVAPLSQFDGMKANGQWGVFIATCDSTDITGVLTGWALVIEGSDFCNATGDANNDGRLNISDAVYLITYVYKGGPAPDPPESGDANCDGTINIADPVYLTNYIFKGGPEPCCP